MAPSPNRRIGRYRPAPGLGKAFHIETPPARSTIHEGPELQRAVHGAALALGRLTATAESLPHPDLLLEMYVRLEAVMSSRIEGTRSSLRDLLAFEGGRKPGPRDDVRQVANHLALLQALDRRPRRKPLSIGELEAAHRTLWRGVPGAKSLGKVRTVQNWIGTPGPLGRVVYVPPAPRDVRRNLQDLVDFVNRDRRYAPVVKAAVAHAYFETIHPFVDGNGRIGRFLFHFVLWKEGVTPQPILYISHFIRLHQAEYYERLGACRDTRGLGKLVLFFLEAIEEVSKEATNRSREVLARCAEFERRASARLGRRAPAANIALRHLYREPIVDVQKLAAWTGLSRKAAYDLVAAMCAAGLLVEDTGGRRNRRFALEQYLELFSVIDEEDETFHNRG